MLPTESQPQGHFAQASDRQPNARFGAIDRRAIPICRTVVALVMPMLLAACSTVVMAPSGDVALQQRNLIVTSTALMLLICVPVIVFTFIFAWHYRASNTSAKYDPDWHHSTQLEVLVWAAPLAIIIALGAVTWLSTHTLDPYRKLTRLDASRPLLAGVKPLKVQVVALDWKWLFIYPDLQIATVNELAAPVDVPIEFKLTSATVMNSFSIPALAGQIYTMAGMQTTLHAVINKTGVYEGLSAHYSGNGFTRMNFKFHGLTEQAFGAWVAKAKGSGPALDRATYIGLERPSIQHPITVFSSVEPGLFDVIVNLCVTPGKLCLSEMMHAKHDGGHAHDAGAAHAHEPRARLDYDRSRSLDHARAPQAKSTKIQIAPPQLNAGPVD